MDVALSRIMNFDNFSEWAYPFDHTNLLFSFLNYHPQIVVFYRNMAIAHWISTSFDRKKRLRWPSWTVLYGFERTNIVPNSQHILWQILYFDDSRSRERMKDASSSTTGLRCLICVKDTYSIQIRFHPMSQPAAVSWNVNHRSIAAHSNQFFFVDRDRVCEQCEWCSCIDKELCWNILWS